MNDELIDTSVEESSDPVTVETVKSEEEGVTVNVTISQPESSEAAVVENEETAAVDPVGIRTFSVTTPTVLETAQSGDVPQVMADVITSVLGEYQRITYTVEEVDAEGNVIATSTEYVPGLAGLDYAWITGAILFGVFIGACFKLLGGLIRS